MDIDKEFPEGYLPCVCDHPREMHFSGNDTSCGYCPDPTFLIKWCPCKKFKLDGLEYIRLMQKRNK